MDRIKRIKGEWRGLDRWTKAGMVLFAAWVLSIAVVPWFN
jgi:hypothetical protein